MISIYKQPKEIQDAIIEGYLKNISMRQLEKDYNTSRTTISKFLTEKGIKTTVGNHYRKYFHNENYFEVIDNEHKAYWLGFMYADGWIQDNSGRHGQDHFGISLSDEDENHLQKFLNDIEATNPINYDKSQATKGTIMAKVELVSQKTVDDLIKHGCYKQKTFILKPPTTVPEEFIHHFIRGFFDGDGSIVKSGGEYFDKYGKYKYSISFSCMEIIANWLKDYFGSGSIVQDKRRTASYTYKFNNAEEFYNKIYKDATIYLDRKYNRFQEYFKQKYGESQGI